MVTASQGPWKSFAVVIGMFVICCGAFVAIEAKSLRRSGPPMVAVPRRPPMVAVRRDSVDIKSTPLSPDSESRTKVSPDGMKERLKKTREYLADLYKRAEGPQYAESANKEDNPISSSFVRDVLTTLCGEDGRLYKARKAPIIYDPRNPPKNLLAKKLLSVRKVELSMLDTMEGESPQMKAEEFLSSIFVHAFTVHVSYQSTGGTPTTTSHSFALIGTHSLGYYLSQYIKEEGKVKDFASDPKGTSGKPKQFLLLLKKFNSADRMWDDIFGPLENRAEGAGVAFIAVEFETARVTQPFTDHGLGAHTLKDDYFKP